MKYIVIRQLLDKWQSIEKREAENKEKIASDLDQLVGEYIILSPIEARKLGKDLMYKFTKKEVYK
jgi:hypothetical protein